MSGRFGSPPRPGRSAAVNEPAGEVVDEHVRRRPPAPLRPYVAWYAGYRQRGVAPALHRGLPSPHLTLIFTLDEPLTIAAHPDPRQPPGRFAALLGGLHCTPALIEHDGAQSGIQVALRPLGARALLGVPAGELGGLDVPADAVLGRVCTEVRARVLAAPGWPGRFAVLDEVLLRLVAARADLAPGARVAPEVSGAWRRLLRTDGAVRVSELAAETGWSSRHLTGRFRAETGLTPKAAARVIRFSRARQLLAVRAGAAAGGQREYRLADLAAACGYFDQAHLAREFRSLAGCSPSQWLAQEGGQFRNVQDGAWLAEGA
jgi:AraC-like DNA-binding protein